VVINHVLGITLGGGVDSAWSLGVCVQLIALVV
jgi:hypothetical protein